MNPGSRPATRPFGSTIAVTPVFVARSMVRPIRTLSEGAQRIGEGNLDQTIDVRTGDELEALADRFNHFNRDEFVVLAAKVAVVLL